MLYPAKVVLTADFLAKTPRGFLLVYDENAGTTRLGWITEATLEDEVLSFQLAPAVSQKHGSSEWAMLDVYAFSAVLSDSRFALAERGGFHCSDAELTHPTFRVYPESSVPDEYVRDHDTLIRYGEVIR